MNIEIKLRSFKEDDKSNNLNNSRKLTKLSNRDQLENRNLMNQINKNKHNRSANSIGRLTKLEQNLIYLRSINKSLEKYKIKRPTQKVYKLNTYKTDNFTNLIDLNNQPIKTNQINQTNRTNKTTDFTLLTKATNSSQESKIIITNSINVNNITDNHLRKRRSLDKPKDSKDEKKVKNLKMYLEGWKNIDDCQPEINLINKSIRKDVVENRLYKFQLELQPVNDSGLNCGLMRLRNKITDDINYQHTVIIEYDEIDIRDKKLSKPRKDALLVHCRMPRANFFQTNQLLWWSSRIRQQMLNQQHEQRALLEKQEQELFKEQLKQTNKSDNKQTVLTESNSNDHHYSSNNTDFLSLLNISTPFTVFSSSVSPTSNTGINTTISLQTFQNSLDENNKQLRKRSRRATKQPIEQQQHPKFSDFLNNLPENFTESVEELIDYSGNYTGTTPIPKLHINVKQNSKFINSTSRDVLPGTPLEMQIYLDDESAKVYGLLVSYLKVTDNNANNSERKDEILLLDGCSIDQYIFGNFESNNNGKSISSFFPAFRFPGSNYVLFIMTVNVCIGQCTPAQCSDHQFAYGRRRKRDLNNLHFNSTNNFNQPTLNGTNHHFDAFDTFTASTTLTPSLLLDTKNDFELKASTSSNRKGRKLSSKTPDVNKLYEVEMSTLIRVVKPKEIKASLIKNEYRKGDDLNLNPNSNSNFNRSLIQSSNNRLVKKSIIRKIKKRYDSNSGKDFSNFQQLRNSTTKSSSLSFILYVLASFTSLHFTVGLRYLLDYTS